ncbi:MAG: hypothetical protein IAF38_14805 [Bacteroidia bacterium]|nr:hypothetical protein [Bacteroidia bacterium]
MANVHIGKKVKEVLGQSRFNVTEFAAKINKTRTVVYDIFERQTMDTGLLMKIGKVLDHDFLSYLLDSVKEERTPYRGKKEMELYAELEEFKKRMAELEKRNVLLEKYVKLLEEKKKVKSPKKIFIR